jgi:ATP-dependent RNA helicase DeaD
MSDSEATPFSQLPAPIQKSLEGRGFAALTPIQLAVVASESSGKNLRISSQTGSGKTVAIGIALLDTLLAPDEPAPAGDEPAEGAKPPSKHAAEPRALLITPTRELALQVHGELSWLYENYPSITIDVATGGTGVRDEQRRLRKKPTVLVGTPGRLLDHVRSGALSLAKSREVVLDEADQMLDMGFKDDLDAIVAELPATRHSHLVSATFPVAVRRLAARFQGDALELQGTALGEANADIEHHAHVIAPGERYEALLNVLLYSLGERCLVFVQRRSDATEVAERLCQEGLAALPLSGELPQAQRNRTLSAFKSGTVNVLIATDVAARGLHVDDIATVVHAELPRDPNTYTHRSGRTGRAGRSGQSVLLVTPTERRRAERLLSLANIDVKWSPVPSPKKIHQRLTKQVRGDLHQRLEQPTTDASELEYANKLLGGYPPEQVVAALLQMAAKPLPREPLELTEIKFESREERRGPAARAARSDSPRPTGDRYKRVRPAQGDGGGGGYKRARPAYAEEGSYKRARPAQAGEEGGYKRTRPAQAAEEGGYKRAPRPASNGDEGGYKRAPRPAPNGDEGGYKRAPRPASNGDEGGYKRTRPAHAGDARTAGLRKNGKHAEDAGAAPTRPGKPAPQGAAAAPPRVRRIVSMGRPRSSV